MSAPILAEYHRTLCDCGRFQGDPIVLAALARVRATADEVMFAREDGEDLDEAEAACRDAGRVLVDLLAARLAGGAS